MDNKIYPNLENICRLCLTENAGTVCIFPKEKNSDKYSLLSIPMRIMTCAALEVHDSDDFPKKICSECRLQLEKSYYFRKQSQASDAKLRKHIRLIGMGKISKVFIKKLEDDDDEDELEFKDSQDFIKEREDAQKQREKLKLENMINEIKLQNEQELKKTMESLKIKCREELTPQIREELMPQISEELTPQIKEEVKKELRKEVEIHLEERLRTEISQQCLQEAKESVRREILEECRQSEIKSLLNELQIFLTNKKIPLDIAETKDRLIRSRPICPANNYLPSKRTSFALDSSKMEIVQIVQELKNENGEKDTTILSDNLNEEDPNTNDEECESEGNFLIYDTDEGFELEKKTSEYKVKYANNDAVETEYYDDEYTDSNSIACAKGEENMDTNDESRETTTSYRIEDNEHGEIKFLKKSNKNTNVIDEQNVEQVVPNDNVVIIKFPEDMEDGYVEEFEKPTKSAKSPEKDVVSSVPSTVTRTTATVEATFLTKTYVNPMQRSTDTPKIFKCEGCPMVFSTKGSVERHIRTHRKVEKTGVTFQCPECRIVVSCGSALRRHMYVHCEEKPFSCNVCGKSFVQKEILKRHMQTHTGIKPHQCPHCDRAFAQRNNLTQHINRNHLEEPRIQQHPCHLCPKRFNHASGLSRHLASHNGVAFQCSECDRTFGDRSSIKRHIANMHGIGRPSKDENK